MCYKWNVTSNNDSIHRVVSKDPAFPFVVVKEVLVRGQLPIKVDYIINKNTGQFAVPTGDRTIHIGSFVPTLSGLEFLHQNPEVVGLSGEFYQYRDGKYLGHVDDTTTAETDNGQ